MSAWCRFIGIPSCVVVIDEVGYLSYSNHKKWPTLPAAATNSSNSQVRR